MTSVDSNFNFLCGRPHEAGPPPSVHMRPPEPDPLPLRVDVINGWPHMVNIIIGESASFSALARLKSKYHSKINVENEISSLIHDLRKCSAINRARIHPTNNCDAIF